MGSIVEPYAPTWRDRPQPADKDEGDVMSDSLTPAPRRAPRDTAAVRRVHPRWLERHSVRLGGALDRVERFMVTGTAGGAMASLAIVAWASASPSNSISCWWSS